MLCCNSYFLLSLLVHQHVYSIPGERGTFENESYTWGTSPVLFMGHYEKVKKNSKFFVVSLIFLVFIVSLFHASLKVYGLHGYIVWFVAPVSWFLFVTNIL